MSALALALWAGLAAVAVAAVQTLYSTFFTFQLFRVVERGTNKDVDEPVPFDDRIRLAFLYRSSIGRFILTCCGGGALLVSKSRQLGEKSDSPKSVADIPKFISNYGVDTSELDVPLTSFQSLNEFFFRKLRAGARPVFSAEDPSIAVQPADSRITVFSSIGNAQKLWIKGLNFSVPALLGDDKLAASFEQGCVAVCRLAPQDYHRFHSPVTGRVTSITVLGTELHTVKSFVINSPVDVFTTNKRVVVTIEDTPFGTVAVVLVGAVYVGSVVTTVKQGDWIEKGQEVGYFAYGGSTVVLLFEPNKIVFDSDLLANSIERVETLVRCGDSLGTLKTASPRSMFRPAEIAL